ncbi:hypothetical protein ACSBR2_039284 [Camellia fascicularis]
MLRRRLRETGGSNRVAHTSYFAQSNLGNYVFRFSHCDRFNRSLLRRTLSRDAQERVTLLLISIVSIKWMTIILSHSLLFFDLQNV